MMVSSVEVLRDFILRELHWDGNADQLTSDFPLIENHVVDSLGLFTLVAFVEDQFGVKILDEDLVPENFGTINAITTLIEKKRVTMTDGT